MKLIRTVGALMLAGTIHAGCSSAHLGKSEGAANRIAPFEAFDMPCLSVADPDVAVGPDLFGVAIQWNAYFYDKTTGLLDHSFKWQAFKGSLISDTHIVYDKSSRKWFITTAVNLGDGSTGVQIMVSTDASA